MVSGNALHMILLLIVALLVLRIPHSAFSVGALLAGCCLPWILSLAGRHGFPRWAVVGPSACLAGGAVLLVAATGARQVSSAHAMTLLVMTASIAVILLVLYVSGRELGARPTLVAYAAGLILNSILYATPENSNLWKYGLAWPVTVILVAIAPSRKLEVAALVLSAALSAIFDYRSMIGLVLIALVTLLVYGHNSRSGAAPLAAWMKASVLFSLSYLGSRALGAIMASGLLGGSITERTQIQSQGSGGFTVTDARPEWGATAALIRHSFGGIGPGVAPTWSEIDAAKTGLAENGVGASGPYVDGYMLMWGDGVQVHSIIGDLWVMFGPAGLAVGLLALLFLGKKLLMDWRSEELLGALLIIFAVWDLLFSPFNPNIYFVIPALILGGRNQPHLRPGRVA